MTRLLMISNLFPLPWEPGRGLFNYQQAHALAASAEVLVWVPVPWHVWWRQPRANRQPRQISDNLRMASFPFFYTPGIFRASYALCLLVSMLLSWPRIRGFRPQRLLASWLYPDAVAGVWLARLLGIPVVMKAHGTDVNVQCRYRCRRAQVRNAAAHSDALYTVSDALARELATAGIQCRRTATVYNGIDQVRFAPMDRDSARQALNVPASQRILLFVGNLKVSKGILDAVRALARLSADTGTHLYMVGEGADRQMLENEVSRLSLSASVTLVGAQPHERVPLWLAAADALMLPSHAEGVPNVVLEAMAMARPVIATEVGGIAEVVPTFAGRLVPAAEPRALADAIQTVLGERWDGARIQQHAQQFSWRANADAVHALWQQEPDHD